MQHNSINPKNKSQVLRLTEQAKRKSRHRLMGSIFLLLVAILVLLNVSSKVKPVPITPEKIDIQSTSIAKTDIHTTASAVASVAKATTASAVIANNKISASAPSVVAASQVVTAVAESRITNNPATTANNAPSVVATDTAQPAAATTKVATNFNARIVVEKAKTAHKPTPEEILNGAEYHHSETSKFYVQLITLKDKNKITALQHTLAQKGIKTFIQPVKFADNSVSYRLRSGPYTSHDSAQQALTKLNQNQ